MTLTRNEDGTLPAYAWPGGYPVYYVTADGGEMCPACANGGNGSEATEDADAEDQWRLVANDVHWEGESLWCDHCGGEIESAYGPVDGE